MSSRGSRRRRPRQPSCHPLKAAVDRCEPRPWIVLIHGGLYEPIGAEGFWVATGVVEALSSRGVEVVAPERLEAPRSWEQDAEHVADQLADVGPPRPVVAGSNGCSTAARLAVARPDLVSRVAFCWPVTVGQGQGQGHEQSLAAQITEVSGAQVAKRLLAGETLRGVTDDELAGLAVPAAVMASRPENPVHQGVTAARLGRLLADPAHLAPMPEPPVMGFDPAPFADAIVNWVRAV